MLRVVWRVLVNNIGSRESMTPAETQLVSLEVQALAHHRVSQAMQAPGAASGAINRFGQRALAQGAPDPGKVFPLEQEVDLSKGVLLGRGIREVSFTLKRKGPRRSLVRRPRRQG